MSRPAGSVPVFASDANYPAGANPWSGQPNKVDPSTILLTGFIPDTYLASDHMNYVLNKVWTWLHYGVQPDAIFGGGYLGTGAADGAGALAGCSGPSANVYIALSDLFFTNLTVSTGVTLKMAGYRLFVNGTLTLNGTATLSCDGGAGSGAVPGAAGGGGIFSGSVGGAGGAATVNGSAATLSNRLGANGGNGGAGAGGALAGAATSSAPATTAGSILVPTSMRTGMLFGSSGVITVTGGCGGGGGGGAVAVESGGGGGGGAGVLFVLAAIVVMSATCHLYARGGAGGAATGAGAGGSGGGGGGCVIFTYSESTGVMTDPTSAVSAVGGSAGAAGAGGGAGSAGGTGTYYVNQL